MADGVTHSHFFQTECDAVGTARSVLQDPHGDLRAAKHPVKSTSLGAGKKRTPHAAIPKPFMGSDLLARKPTFPNQPEPKKDEQVSVAVHKKGTARVAHLPRVVCVCRFSATSSAQTGTHASLCSIFEQRSFLAVDRLC